MDVRFNPYQLIKELLEEKQIVLQEKTWVKDEKPILVKDENKPILDFDETRDKQKMVMDESSPKAPNLESTFLKPQIEKTVQVRLHDQIDEAIEIQVQDQQVKVLHLKKKSLPSSSIIPLANESEQSKLEH